jgi:hypothetical protein
MSLDPVAASGASGQVRVTPRLANVTRRRGGFLRVHRETMRLTTALCTLRSVMLPDIGRLVCANVTLFDSCRAEIVSSVPSPHGIVGAWNVTSK